MQSRDESLGSFHDSVYSELIQETLVNCVNSVISLNVRDDFISQPVEVLRVSYCGLQMKFGYDYLKGEICSKFVERF
jgi:hypothetical protein